MIHSVPKCKGKFGKIDPFTMPNLYVCNACGAIRFHKNGNDYELEPLTDEQRSIVSNIPADNDGTFSEQYFAQIAYSYQNTDRKHK